MRVAAYGRRIEYREVPQSAVPASLRWDVPPHRQGQTVEVAFAAPGSRAQAGEGDEWMRRHDRSDSTTTYYRRAEEG